MYSIVGQASPDFTAKAIMPNDDINENFNLTKYLDGKIGILFFYPLDFTFVCPTEIISFNNKLSEFASRGAKIIGISVDSHFSHLAWKKTPLNKGGIGDIQFPLVSDITKSIAKDYGILINDAVALRATFLIDEDGIVRHQLVNDLPLGRNVDEAIRMVDAYQHFKKYGEVCPAGWKQGEDAMTASSEGVADYLSSNSDKL